MAQMHTLILNGQAYTLVDTAAARIDDSVVGETTWSSKTIIDRLCPGFTVTGEAVCCQPVAGYPLEVASRLKPVQMAIGDPSPENVCPITGWTDIKLTHSNAHQSKTYTRELGQTVYGGSYDWKTGILTVDTACLQLTTDMEIYPYQYNGTDGIRIPLALDGAYSRAEGLCSHAAVVQSVQPVHSMWIGANGNNTIYWVDILHHLGLSTIESFKQWLDTQTVMVCYKLEMPFTVQLLPERIPALEGVNTLQSDTGDTTVTGKADLAALLE